LAAAVFRGNSILIQRFAQNRLGRDFIVGDVHGMFSALEDLLDAAGFDPAADRLFCAGDLVDRGPESTKVLEWLVQPWFYSVRGNHEQMVLAAMAGTLAPEKHIKWGGAWFHGLPAEKRTDFALAFDELPLVIELETQAGLVGIIHADCPVDDWRCLADYLNGSQKASAMDICLWSSERYRRRYHVWVRGVRAVVHGHTVVPRKEQLGNVLFIDTGAVFEGGKFTMIDAATLEPAGAV
jgi:serine/threonine protein phosphatase 1